MDLAPHIARIRSQLLQAADAGGDEARALADRLVAPLEAAVRLALQDALTAAAEEITCELAPGAVELRLRGRDPEFVVIAPPAEQAASAERAGAEREGGMGWSSAAALPPEPSPTDEPEEGATARISLRLPDHLKARVESAARHEGLSVNTWLVRAASAALQRTDPARRYEPRAPISSHRYTGWAR